MNNMTNNQIIETIIEAHGTSVFRTIKHNGLAIIESRKGEEAADKANDKIWAAIHRNN